MLERRRLLVEPEKRCYRCKRELPASRFSRNRAQRDGLQGSCKLCKVEEENERRERRRYPTEPDDLPRTVKALEREECRLSEALASVRRCRQYVASLIEEGAAEAAPSVSVNPDTC